MFSNRISKPAVILLILAVAAVTVSFVARPAGFLTASHSYERSEQIPAEPAYIALERQINREYILGERYGQRPEAVTQFSAEQIRREYLLGERYGVTPQSYAHEKALREYWLGQRYGQTPLA